MAALERLAHEILRATSPYCTTTEGVVAGEGRGGNNGGLGEWVLEAGKSV